MSEQETFAVGDIVRSRLDGGPVMQVEYIRENNSSLLMMILGAPADGVCCWWWANGRIRKATFEPCDLEHAA